MATYKASVKYQDAMGRQATREVLAEAADETAALAFFNAYAVTLQGVTKCAVIGYTYSREVQIAAVAAAGANVDAGFTIGWATGLPVDPTTNIIDPLDSLKLAGGVIDQTDAGIVQLFSYFLTGGVGRLNRNNPVNADSVKYATVDK